MTRASFLVTAKSYLDESITNMDVFIIFAVLYCFALNTLNCVSFFVFKSQLCPGIVQFQASRLMCCYFKTKNWQLNDQTIIIQVQEYL